MREKFLTALIAFVLMNLAAHADDRLRVYVLDTGINFTHIGHKWRCPESPKNIDTNGHGTFIAEIIVKNGDASKFCLVDLKYYYGKDGKNATEAKIIKFLSSIVGKKVGVLNFSGGGPSVLLEERRIMIELLKQGFKLSLAAGNHGDNLDKNCNFFPACYFNRDVPEIVRVSTTNFGHNTNGPVNRVQPLTFWGKTGASSAATAVTTREWVKQLIRGNK